MIEVRRRTALADARARRDAERWPGRPGTRVGFDPGGLAWAASEAAASAGSPEETMDALGQAIACLRADVAADACADWYGPECGGVDPEAEQVAACLKKIEMSRPGELTPYTMQDALTCAGVEVTPENEAAFAEFVRKRETAWHSLPKGTVATAALAVRRGISPELTAHSTQQWRDRLETFQRTFSGFHEKWRTGGAGEVGVWGGLTGPSMSDVAPYVKQYDAFRKQFIDAGGETECPALSRGTPTWVWIVGGAVVLGVVTLLLWQAKTAASLVGAAKGVVAP